MKNQYFGDINDYRKYGLLRVLCHETGLRCLVGWMLTLRDGRPDGGFTQYLTDPDTWRHYDPVLFDALRSSVVERGVRDVGVFESSGLLDGASFFSDIVPDRRVGRTQWTEDLLTASEGHDLVFLDPDTGIEVKSKPMNRKGSSKYVYWQELRGLYSRGTSLLVYQHYHRQKREKFIPFQAERLAAEVGTDSVITFRTKYVLFLLAAQHKQKPGLRSAADCVARKWATQIEVGDYPAPLGSLSQCEGLPE